MSDYLPYIVLGLTSGSIYGLAAIGLVLTYKTSGLFNFAHGALAATGAYFFYWLHVTHHWPWGLAFAVVVGGLGPLLGLLMELLARRLAAVGTVLKVVGTVGIILVVQGLATIKYQAGLITVPRFLPAGTFTVFGASVSWGQVITMVIGAVAAVALYLFLRFTYLGKAMRGVVDDSELLALTGGSPVMVRRASWMVGTTLAVLAGVLIAPNLDLDAVVLTFLVVQAFGAAALGAFASLPVAYLGGCAIGIVAALSTKWTSAEFLKGFPSALPFYVLLAVLLILPRRKLVTAGVERVVVRAPWRAPAATRLLTGAAVTGLLVALPWLVGYRITSFTNALVQVMLLLSLGLLVRTSGQVSLCHMAFAAVGAVAFSQLTVEHGWPWLAAALVAGLIAVPVGALVAIPAIRLSGLFLALATFGFGVAVEYMFYPLGFMFTTNASGRVMPHPSFAEDDKSFYLVVLGFVVITAIAVVAIVQSRLGRLMRGMSDSPVAIATLGLNLRVTRVLVFCISAFFASIAGVLLGVQLTTATAESYPSFQSLVLLAVLALAPFGEPWYALFAAAGLAVIPIYVDAADTTNWLNVMFGVFAVIVALQGGTPEAPPAVRRFFERFGGLGLGRLGLGRLGLGRAATGSSPAAAPIPATAATAATAAIPAAGESPRPGLEITGLTVRHGGLTAVKDLGLQAPLGRITGLIGPNGAGKTTTFNASTGLLRPSTGTIRLHGRDVTRLNPAARGRRGLGRTFQRMELFDSLTVAQNVELGREAALAGTNPWRQLSARRHDRAEVAARTSAALELCGIGELAEQHAGLLSTGDRRLVELARALAGQFDVLLLDEPSSGLDREERARFADILRRVTVERGAGILLVEHDMSLVMGICDYVYVLDFGALIFEGPPDQVQASPVVQAAYLGADAVEPVLAAPGARSLTLEVDHG